MARKLFKVFGTATKVSDVINAFSVIEKDHSYSYIDCDLFFGNRDDFSKDIYKESTMCICGESERAWKLHLDVGYTVWVAKKICKVIEDDFYDEKSDIALIVPTWALRK